MLQVSWAVTSPWQPFFSCTEPGFVCYGPFGAALTDEDALRSRLFAIARGRCDCRMTVLIFSAVLHSTCNAAEVDMLKTDGWRLGDENDIDPLHNAKGSATLSKQVLDKYGSIFKLKSNIIPVA